jgi:hypothetical protein
LSYENFLELWPIISAVGVLAAIIVSFRSEVLIRLKYMEQKIATLYELWNNRRDK